MGKFLMGVFFVIIVSVLCVTIYNGTVKTEKELEGKVETQVEKLYVAPGTITP